MKYIIYKITNTINNKFYIGKHKTENIHDSYLGSGILIKRAVKKYGKDKFIKEILFICDDENVCNEAEERIVDEILVNDEMCYNLRTGGHGGSDRCSDETRAKIRAARAKQVMTEESNRKRSETQRGRKLGPSKIKGIAKDIISCPHCGKSGGKPAMNRWHFDNCNQR
ncbi:SegD homing endonuclease [Vibrio phage nt-1]|uniref:SegD homing endonuclease n=1 Tax=Vibrio phage nt-1 TaxID=115992 RepID=R9TEF4_9CAUD|nr:homing endonuclease [Vibrio phage nt-1]AGN30131.1 SegD homing endonuclease [Vibrio phage nt-1]